MSASPFQTWLEARCAFAPDRLTLQAVLFADYIEWSLDNGLPRPTSARSFGESLNHRQIILAGSDAAGSKLRRGVRLNRPAVQSLQRLSHGFGSPLPALRRRHGLMGLFSRSLRGFGALAFQAARAIDGGGRHAVLDQQLDDVFQGGQGLTHVVDLVAHGESPSGSDKVTSDPFPPYRPLGIDIQPAQSLEDLARWIHAERQGRGLEIEDHQLAFENEAGERATVSVKVLDKAKTVVRSFLVVTAGENAAALGAALKATKPAKLKAAA